MTAIISKSLRNELIENTRKKYPSCAETIRNMYRSHAKRTGHVLTDDQLEIIVVRILGKCP